MPTESRKKPQVNAAAEAALEAAITAHVAGSSILGATPITMEAILAMGWAHKITLARVFTADTPLACNLLQHAFWLIYVHTTQVRSNGRRIGRG